MEENETPIEENNTPLPDSGEGEQDQADNEEVKQEAPPAQNNEIEDRARKQGWKPKEEYGGNPKYWKEAEAYVDRADKELPIANATIRGLEEKIGTMENSFEKMKEYSKLQVKYAKEEAIDKAKAKYIRSVDEDGRSASDAIDGYEQDKDNIEKRYTPTPKPEQQQQQQQPIPRDAADWMAKNPWSTEKDALGYAAQGYEKEIFRANPYMTTVEVFEAVKRRAVQDFPERFNNPKRNVSSIEGGGTIHATNKPKLKFNSLSSAEQVDANKLIRAGLFKNGEDYVKFSQTVNN